jgi:hypothetical protein
VFALLDYLRYRKRSGRFSRYTTQSYMGAAFEGGLSRRAVEALQPGAMLFVETLSDWRSWLIMYLTNSEVSHVAMYVGDGEILHATTSGSARQPLSALYSPDIRILPGVPSFVKGKGSIFAKGDFADLVGLPYPWWIVVRKGVRILTGRDWPYFRWRFWIDLAVLFLLLDMPLLLTGRQIWFSWLSLLYLLTIMANAMLWKIRPLKSLSASVGKPCDWLYSLMYNGGELMFDAYALSKQKRKAPLMSA